MIFLPLLSALILRWAIPPLTNSLLANYDFDLRPYYPVILAYFLVVMAPITFAVLTGFLLLDEKDDRTLTALQVTPLPLNSYIAYRVAIPVILTVVLMFLTFPLAGLGSLSVGDVLIVALAAAPMSPMFAMFLASQAQNKVQGFALMKMSGFLLFLPILSYFVDSRWQFAFGIIPTYWPMKVYWTLAANGEGVWWMALIAIAYQSAVAFIFIRRFNRVMTQ
jgi:fluoroquinolone transport system permease protein